MPRAEGRYLQTTLFHRQLTPLPRYRETTRKTGQFSKPRDRATARPRYRATNRLCVRSSLNEAQFVTRERNLATT